MIDLNKLTKGQKAFLNALVVGGIAFFSTVATTGGVPTMDNIVSGITAAGLACLIRINDFLSKDDEEKIETEEDKSNFKLGMLI